MHLNGFLVEILVDNEPLQETQVPVNSEMASLLLFNNLTKIHQFNKSNTFIKNNRK